MNCFIERSTLKYGDEDERYEEEHEGYEIYDEDEEESQQDCQGKVQKGSGIPWKEGENHGWIKEGGFNQK